MLLRVHDVHVTSRHVEVPDRCGGCGARVEAAIECILEEGATCGLLSPAEPDEPAGTTLMEFSPDPSAAGNRHGRDLYFVTGYRCGRCGKVLAEGEYSESEE